MQYTLNLTWHGTLLVELAKQMRPSLYIEFGTQSGQTIFEVAEFCDRAIGVDINPPDARFSPADRWTFYQMTTDRFVDLHLKDLPNVELALVDADHRSEAAYGDARKLMEHAAPNGMVAIHDTYPPGEKHLQPGYCHDSYLVPEKVKKYGHHSRWEVLTIPIPPGLTLVRTVPGPHPLHWKNRCTIPPSAE